jgi:hypothetical protein
MHVYATRELAWKGDRLSIAGKAKGPHVSVVQDQKYPNMWRVRYPDGQLSDMVNRTRTRDAAKSILLGILNHEETRHVSPLMRF